MGKSQGQKIETKQRPLTGHVARFILIGASILVPGAGGHRQPLRLTVAAWQIRFLAIWHTGIFKPASVGETGQYQTTRHRFPCPLNGLCCPSAAMGSRLGDIPKPLRWSEWDRRSRTRFKNGPLRFWQVRNLPGLGSDRGQRSRRAHHAALPQPRGLCQAVAAPYVGSRRAFLG